MKRLSPTFVLIYSLVGLAFLGAACGGSPATPPAAVKEPAPIASPAPAVPPLTVGDEPLATENPSSSASAGVSESATTEHILFTQVRSVALP